MKSFVISRLSFAAVLISRVSGTVVVPACLLVALLFGGCLGGGGDYSVVPVATPTWLSADRSAKRRAERRLQIPSLVPFELNCFPRQTPYWVLTAIVGSH